MIGAALLSLCLAAEQWADEPVPPPEPVKVVAPRFGPVGGVHLGVSIDSTIGPDVGARAGVRVRLGQHTALSLFGDVELVWFEPRRVQPPLANGFAPDLRPRQPDMPELLVGQRWMGFARLELISSSASAVVLVPKLTAGLYFGAGIGHVAGEPVIGLLSGGVHLGLTRLEPSGWWFPVFLDLGLEGTPLGGGTWWRFAFGVGL